MTVCGAFNIAFEPDNGAFDMVIHTASSLRFAEAQFAADFLESTIRGTKEVLHGIQRVDPETVRHEIITSSLAVIGSFGLTDESNTRKTGNSPPKRRTRSLRTCDFKQFLGDKAQSDTGVLKPPMVYGHSRNPVLSPAQMT
ncbi:Nn.00g027530.m01.CDS01 [Neocucurbitaria sp. VM-36]